MVVMTMVRFVRLQIILYYFFVNFSICLYNNADIPGRRNQGVTGRNVPK